MAVEMVYLKYIFMQQSNTHKITTSDVHLVGSKRVVTYAW
jgi:hypothetical protein